MRHEKTDASFLSLTKVNIDIMNREVKFRGKRVDIGDWMHGYLREVFGYKKRVFMISPAQTFEEDGITDVHEGYVQSDTIGQFTGLHDKNGKEIYECDILRVREYINEAIHIFDYDEIKQLPYDDVRGEMIKEWIGEVKFEESCFVINDTYLTEFHGDMRFSFPIYEIEIIGNVFDNPELLED